MDPHQKTILSDDFGMGIALVYLVKKLRLRSVFDGRYFVQYLAPTVRAKVAKIAKNGQFKSPDFIGKDVDGKWHAVECKGTQTSVDSRAGQIASGAVQKANIIFPRAVRGEKLVSAVLIGRENGGFASSLRIDDPEGDIAFEINKTNIEHAEEAVTRATVARAMGVAGFQRSAAIIASPYGARPYDRETSGEAEALRMETLTRMRKEAAFELSQTGSAPGRIRDGSRIGREIRMQLPRPIEFNGKSFNYIEAALTVPNNVYEIIGEVAVGDSINSKVAFEDFKIEGLKRAGEETVRELQVGNIFKGELRLRSL